MSCPVPYNLSQAPSQPVQITMPRYKYNYFSISASSSASTNPSMDQQAKCTKAEIQDFNRDDNAWVTSMLGVQKVQNNHILGAPVSEKELKIRSELEMEVERNLEEEIKDGIYNLSLRLHRLYQRQKERNVKDVSEDNRNRALSEVNISIKMEGKNRVEIKETKKEATEKGRLRSYRSEDVKEVSGFNAKRFDWEKTLRAGSGSVTVNKTNGSSKQRDIMRRSDPNLHSNCKFDNGRGKKNGTSGRGKRDKKVDHNLLQLGWKV